MVGSFAWYAMLLSCRTLDKAEGRGRRLHKRSILKHHSKSVDASENEVGNSTVKMDPIRPSNMKVKFAGSLRETEFQS